MTELRHIVDAAATAQKQLQPALLATVVRVQGSAYRRPGARMLLTGDGWKAGCISGGCLETDIIRKAWWRTEGGKPVVVTYDSTVEEGGASFDDALSWGLGLGCNGIIEVLLERLTPESEDCPVGFIGECLRRRRAGIMATVIAAPNSETIGQRMLWHENERTFAVCTVSDPNFAVQIAGVIEEAWMTESHCVTLSFLEGTVFLERVLPPTPLLICGANHDAAPLARLANAVGWQVTVVDPWAGSTPRPERFPGAEIVVCCVPRDLATQIAVEDGAFAVVMSHNLAHDAAFLRALLPLPVTYIGILGPRRRTEHLLEAIHASDETRLHGPIGLDIGADNPDTIALSILAEMQAVKTNRGGGFLRNRGLPIHDPSAATVARSERALA